MVLDRFGPDALARIVASLRPRDREILDRILLPAGFYPAGTAARFDAAIVAETGISSELALWELGRAGAAENLERLQASFTQGKIPLAFPAPNAPGPLRAITHGFRFSLSPA